MSNDRLILSSNFTVNWVRQGKTKSERRNAKANCDLRQGSLEGDASSFVVVTICEEEVYALMLIGQRSFFVQPLTNGQHVMFQPKNEKWWSIRNNSSFVSVNPENPAGKSNKFEVEESKRKSKRSKRDSLSHDVQGFYNLSGDVFDVEYPEAEKLILYDEKDDVCTEYNDTIVEKLSIDVNPVEKCSVGVDHALIAKTHWESLDVCCVIWCFV
ncbi:uncharacterized protein LOC126927217 isoform X1 [Bombus affinis]|uniref:uncharacterized protein LOC126926971 isoform X1 n=1 Tax=Bombus affinis TaxID=309941 RepID=UPI0021B71927|nr:uncharacterized protein LOC126926971 isoform X1 [Bombus affinis]XP_050599230.1 uncharacterized protein LOC126926971 isoform X1 [Bombus affinis]XP_050599231.1 uncharacterized protein LOC126926971 isoform X1 [Bombus affinis]XP_050599451.1 uncharacterized protein LOC126927217 isoform X1 [Bombus affinis]